MANTLYADAVKSGPGYDDTDSLTMLQSNSSVPGLNTHEPANPPNSYAGIVKEGAGYEAHDLQPADVVPGIISHAQSDRPASYAGVVKDGSWAYHGDTPKKRHRKRALEQLAKHEQEHHDDDTETEPAAEPPKAEAGELTIDMAANSHVTLARRSGQSAVKSGFPNPALARARFAPDPQYGASADADARVSWENCVRSPRERRAWQLKSTLEQHCAFFDRDDDGIIWPTDTYVAFTALGFGFILSFVAMVVIHGGFSYLSKPGILPDPFFRFYIGNAYHCKHGSDSGAYDTEGRYIPQKFDDIFAKYSSSPDQDYLTLWDIFRMLHGNRVVVDPFGWFAAAIEWLALYYMVWPEDRKLRREDVRAMFSGELFYKIAAKRNNSYYYSKYGHHHHHH